MGNTHHDDFGGLHRDLRATGTIIGRRRLLRMAASLGIGGSALPLLGWGESPMTPSDIAGSGACARIPQETAGPFPGDGSNGPSDAATGMAASLTVAV